MRLVGTLNDEREAIIFSSFLNRKNIEHQIEINKNTDWGSSDYGTSQCLIWIQDEDQVSEASRWYQFYLANPFDPIFKKNQINPPSNTIPPESQTSPSSIFPPPLIDRMEKNENQKARFNWNRKPTGPLTRFFLVLCCSVFLLAQILTSTTKSSSDLASSLIFSSPVAKAILYDYPEKYQLLDHFLKTYGYEELENPQSLSHTQRALLQKINQTPYWQGLYALIQNKGFLPVLEDLPFNDVPMFEKIRQGEVWRLFSPCIYHSGLVHILFNMLWLIVLGKQIEQRIGALRYLLFILFVGILSNTAQYLISGPNFVGFSGILMAMLGFIWSRQRYAAWEGYQLDKSTMIFMLIFILGMAVIQFFSFFLEKSLDLTISPGIANVAHLSGLVLGLILGRLNFFNWRHI